MYSHRVFTSRRFSDDLLAVSSALPPGATILFISSAPNDQRAIDSSGEYRAISEAVRGHYKLVARLAAQPEDLVFALAEVKPQVLHFSGHGTGKDGLAFENDQRQMVLLSRQALETVFAARELISPLQVVVLNACWSVEQASVIAAKGPDTIGMKIDVLDDVAKAFAGGFYRTLAAGLTIEGAHAAALGATASRGLPEADTPVLVEGAKSKAILPKNMGLIDRRILLATVDQTYPGDDLKGLFFESFAEFDKAVVGLALPRPQLLREFLRWVLERPRQIALLQKLLKEKVRESEE
jgi:hypothetical protein